MIFALEALPAKHGDCLMLHYGTAAAPKLAVIDGGPGGVFRGSLKPRIAQIRAKLGLADTVPLSIELLMVSHVDDDHIRGVLDWTGELASLFENRQALPVAIRRVWHNSFDRILGSMPKALLSSVLSSLLASNDVGAGADPGRIDDPDKEKLAAQKMLASVAQGDQLRQDIAKLGLASNVPFADVIMARGDKTSIISFPGDLKFTVVGPLKEELLALQKAHDKWVRESKKKKAEADAELAAYVDKSVPNLSSIVVLAEAGGKKMLLTGDARGDKILNGLDDAGLMKGGKLHVDVMKLPHHGSDHNVDDDFFTRITADHYVASGDGKHGNPERKTLEMVFKARDKADSFTLHLTYGVGHIDEGRKRQREEDNAKAKKKGKPQKPWKPATDALSTLFDTVGRRYTKFKLVEPKQGSGVTVSLGGEGVPY